MFSWFGKSKKKKTGKKPRGLGTSSEQIETHHASHVSQHKKETSYNARKRRENAANTRRYKKLGENA